MKTEKINKIVTYSFCEPFLDNLMAYLKENYLNQGKDISRLAFIFGGKRPALFLNRALAQCIKKSFFPPKTFSIDEFIYYILSKKEMFSSVVDLDGCYALYNLAKEHTPDILKGRETFAQFLPWTREILSFIDQLDLENISKGSLLNIQSNAEIGYPVPTDINRLLLNIVTLRDIYHRFLLEKKMYSRGFQYLRASQLIEKIEFEEFDEILFCNFFYLNRSEEKIIKNLYERDKAFLFFQGDERRWPVLKRISKHFDTAILEGETVQKPKFNLKLYSAFDVHAQVAQVREILKKIEPLDKTVIVLPNADNIIPLLSEISLLVEDFNISMGYPLKRSSLYSLFEFIFKAQISKRTDGYYAKDYLKLLRHPFVKNLKLSFDPSVTRVVIHKIEEILTGQEKTSLSGSLFINPDDFLKEEELYTLTQDILRKMDIQVTHQEFNSLIKELNQLLFYSWEGIGCFSEFSFCLKDFLEVFIQKSFLSQYPLNLKIAERMLTIVDELKNTTFNNEIFSKEDIFKIFHNKIEGEMVSFIGSPLKGLQILGLFETRSLNFDNVIVLDVNEGTLPHLKICEPLIPREVMISLSLDRLELEEEIQRYQFMRLISSAQNVHLVYQENQNKEKSRFVEELIWEEEKYHQKLNVVDITRPSFEVKVSKNLKSVKKTEAMISFLRGFRYSASSINTYLRSPLQFYYDYVLGLREKEDLLDEPQARQVGTFVHDLMEATFKNFVGKKPTIDTHFRNYFFKAFEDRFAETFGKGKKSDVFLLKSVLEMRLNRFLDNEANHRERKVSEVLFVEQRFEDVIPLSCGDIHFVYRVDRIDKLEDNSILIIDYKTGAIDPMPKAIDTIEKMPLTRETILENVKSFQIPLYFYYFIGLFQNKNVEVANINTFSSLEKRPNIDFHKAFNEEKVNNKLYQDRVVNAAFYNLRTMELHKFIDGKMDYRPQEMISVFMRALDFVMHEILDPEVSFIEPP